MGNTSRTRLQAIQVNSSEPSTLNEANDAGTRGYQKKQLLQIASLSTKELEALKKRLQDNAERLPLLDKIIDIVKDQFRNVDSHVGELANLTTRSIKFIIAEVFTNRDSLLVTCPPCLYHSDS